MGPLKRWQIESIVTRHRDDPHTVALFVVIVATAMVLAPIVVGAAICAGWLP
jgi:hypothetical protein